MRRREAQIASRTATLSVGWRYCESSHANPVRLLTEGHQVLNHRSALLSNYEVLTLLRELESDHLARTKTALRIKKEEEAAGNLSAKIQAPTEDVCENLRTIEVEVRSIFICFVWKV